MTKPKTTRTPVMAEPVVEPPAPFSVIDMPKNPDDLPEPTLGPYFVRGAKRNYVHKKFHFGRVVTVMKDGLPGGFDLPEKENGFLLYDFTGDKAIPARLIGQAWHFFRAVWNRHHTEAMVDITWHPEKGYRLFVPPQSTSSGHVAATRNTEHYERGSRHVGTIHSHCNFSAFHSGTDTGDAKEHDGLHITIGFVDKNPPQYATMIAVDGVMWDFKIEEVIDSRTIPFEPSPDWWMRYVDTRPVQFKPVGNQANKGKKNGNTSPPHWKPAATTPGTVPPRTTPNVVSATPKPLRSGSGNTIPWLDDDDWEASYGEGKVVTTNIDGTKKEFVYESLDDLIEEVINLAQSLKQNERQELMELAGLYDQVMEDLARYGIAPYQSRFVFDLDLWQAYMPEPGEDRTHYQNTGAK